MSKVRLMGEAEAVLCHGYGEQEARIELSKIFQDLFRNIVCITIFNGFKKNEIYLNVIFQAH